MLKGEIKAVAPYGKDLTKLNVSIEPIQGGTPVLYPETESVYLSRPTEGTGELMELVGGTVAWNQLVQDGDFATLSKWNVTTTGVTSTISDETLKYTVIDNTIQARPNTWQTVAKNPSLTVRLNHVYLLTAYAKVNSAVSNYPFGFLFANQAKVGLINAAGGVWKEAATVIKPDASGSYNYTLYYSNYITQLSNGDTIEVTKPQVIDLTQMLGPTIADYVYSLEQATAGSGIAWLKSYDLIDDAYHAYSAPTLQSVEATSHVTKDANDTVIATYPLDSDLVLRGIPKLTNGVLSYDGDTYEWDGTVTRNFGERAYQAGDESLTDAITDGANTVYKLTTPTTESADPYTAVQTVEDGGTEEFTTSNGVPVGVKGRFAVTAPLSGYTTAYIYTGDTQGTQEANYTVNFGREVYGGMLDAIDGTVTEKMAEIDEYNGETIGTPWLSSLDVYAEGTTPTKGAQVVYPTIWSEFSVTAPTITTAKAYWWANCGEVDWGYELVGLGLMPVITLADPFE